MQYHNELTRHRQQRSAYLTSITEEPDPQELATLVGRWRKGDTTQRWEVMNALFERIHVKQDRKVKGYTPRADRANRVGLLIYTAFDYIYGWSERETDGPGAAVGRLGSGGAGI